MSHTLTLTFAPVTAATSSTATFAAGDESGPGHLSGVALPLRVPSNLALDGNRYEFTRGPSNPDELIDAVDEHDDWAVVGRLAGPLEVDDEAGIVRATARLFNTTRGRDVAVEAAEGVRTGFSVKAEFSEFTERPEDGVRVVDEWTAKHLGIVRRPAFTESRGLTAAASAQERTPSMDPEKDTPPAGPKVVELPTVAELAALVAVELDKQKDAPVHPLARFANERAFFAAFAEADEEERRKLAVSFALVDQVTADSPALVVPQWRTRLIANLDARRPTVGALGTVPLPDAGLKVNWPMYAGDLDALIAEQTVELEELESVKVPITSGEATIKTAGGASRISYQDLMRTSPAYRAMYQSIMDSAFARFTEAVFERALAAGGTDAGATPAIPAADDGHRAFAGLLFDASAQVEDATGKPATYVGVASDVWVELGLTGLVNPKYGTQNVAGTASAATLTIDVNGLPVKRAPFLSAGEMLVTNDEAAKFSESGVMIATEEDVAHLGQNVATWGMFTPAEIYFPAGVLKFDRIP